MSSCYSPFISFQKEEEEEEVEQDDDDGSTDKDKKKKKRICRIAGCGKLDKGRGFCKAVSSSSVGDGGPAVFAKLMILVVIHPLFFLSRCHFSLFII